MNILEQIRQKNPSLRKAPDNEIKGMIRSSPEFNGMNEQQFDRFVTGGWGDQGNQDSEETPGFIGGASAGIDQIQGMGGGLLMAAGDKLKSDALWEGGRDMYQRNMEEAANNDLGYGFTDIRSAGEAFNWARYTAGNLLPTLGVSMAGGGIGGLAVRAAAGQAAKQAAMRGGQALGSYAASSGMETGAIMGETEDADVALAHGSVAGALDFLAPFQILRKVGGKELADKAVGEISEGVLRDLQKTAGRSTKGAFGQGSLTTALTEAPTEGLQGLIGQHANYWAENNGETLLNNLGEVDYKAFVDEMAAGGLMGPAIGGPTGLIERSQAKSQFQKIEEARKQAEAAGGDALDQTMAAQAAEQDAAQETDPAFDQPLGDIQGNMDAAQSQPYDITQMGRDLGAQQSGPTQPLSEAVGTDQSQSNVVYQQDGVTITQDSDNQFSAALDGSDLQAFGRDPGEARRRLFQLSERNQPQAPVLQNRDRSDPGYVQQMEAIANDPDYDQVSASKTPDAGAPMVFAQGNAPLIENADTGRQETITMADGQGATRKIRAQYAVVEAGNLKASHRADGRQNTDYGRDGLIALNNGRTAGLQEAYSRGVADTYRQNLREDAQALGIDPAAIDSKQQPVLVRLFDGTQLEGIDDPGAASNERLSADLSPSEQAQTDARRITPDVLASLQPGDPTESGNTDFVRAALTAIVGDNRKTELRDRNGLLTAAGQKRLRSALVERAYSDATLTQELAEATDNDLKTLGDALAESAGRWALMRERAREGSINPDMDVTDALVSAVNMIRKSRQEGRSLKDVAGQVDAFAGETDQMAVHMLHLFYHGSNYNRIRAKDAITGALQGYIDSALQSSPAPDMFGQMATPQNALEAQRGQIEGTQPQATASRVQPDGADNREAGPAGERPGRDQGRAQDAEASRNQEEVKPGITEDGQQFIKKNGQAFANTRGLGYYFHGTSAPISSLSDEVWTSLNIYGQGLYTTEAVDIADGYMKKGRGEDPVLYRASIPENLPLYDLDQPMTPEVASMAEDVLDDMFPGDLESGSLGEVMDEARVDSSAQMVPADEVQGMLDSIRYNLERMGYHGYTHVGGGKTNNPNHQVRIYWTPSQDGISLQRESIEQYRDSRASDFAPGPDLELTTQTEQDLAQREQQRQQAEQEEAQARRDEEQRAQADAEADDFVLSGSDSPVDQAEARGQGNMLDQQSDAQPQQEGAQQSPAEAAPDTPSITWKKDKDSNKIWRSNDGQIITDESFGVGGVRTKFFPVYANDTERGAGNNYTSGESLAEAKRKAVPQQESAQPEAPETSPEQTAPNQPIDDFGEKIEGARKDYASKLRDAKERDVSAVPLSKSWPEPNYQKMLDDGVPVETAALVRALRDEVPTKPQKSWKLRGWAEMVTGLRDMASTLMENQDVAGKVIEQIEAMKASGRTAREAKHILGRMDLYQEFGHQDSFKGITFGESFYQMYMGENNVNLWEVERLSKATAFGNMPRTLATGKTREEALANLRKALDKVPESTKEGKAVRFNIYRDRYSNDVFIGKKIGKDVVRMKTFDDDIKAARKYLEENQQELEAQLEKMKQIPNHRKSANSPRVGVDHRNGGDVTPEAFSETFGFRGVQFGNFVNQSRRQQDLNEAYDGLMDLAGILDIPAKAISLNGELGLAFGARGKGGKNPAAAHYERNNIVINLTKKAGAGSLAHEWWHSLDNYFSRERGGKPVDAMATEGDADANVRPEVAEAFRNVRRAVNRTKLKQRSQKLDKVRTKAYWSTDPEMTARAFESYVIEKLRDQGASNDYLANIVSEDYWKASEALGKKDSDSYPYPEAAEVPEIRAAYDNFFQTVETQEDDAGNVAMYSRTGYRRTPNTRVQSMSAPEARRIANVLMKNWKGRPPMIVAEEIGEFPNALQAEIYRAGAENDMRAVFWDNKVYVLAPRIPNRRALEEVILHETIGHYGLRRMMGDNLKMLLERVYRDLGDSRQASQLKKTYFGGNFNPSNQAHRLTIAEELIAHLAESGRHQYRTLFERILTVVRNSLRRMGFTIEITERDLLALLDGADKVVRSGGISVPSSSDIYFSRADQTNSEAFNKWFGDSKVVDERGQPLVVYHGTRDVFDEFDMAHAGKNTPSGDFWAKGAFFHSDYADAEFYSEPEDADYNARSGDNPRVISAYLSMQNPLIVDVDSNETNYFDQNEARLVDEMEDGEHDGIAVNGKDGTLYFSVDPGQIKSATDNSGTFDPSNPDIRFSRAGENMEVQPFGAPDDTMIKRTVSRIADKFTVLKGVQKQIADRMGEIPKEQDAYQAEELFHGKVENDIRIIREEMIEPLSESMAKHNIDMASLDEYLYALHAPERNAVIAERNPDMLDGGSGMTNAEAAEIVAKVAKSGKQAEYRDLANQVQAITAERRQIIRDAGLEDSDTLGAWEESYKNYVPLKGFAADETQDGRPRTGKGFAISGKESKMAAGRSSKAASPTANAISDLSEAVLRRRKNEVGRTFMNLVAANPNPDYWQIFSDENPEVQRTVVKVKDQDTGKPKWEVREQVIPMAMMSDRYFTTKVDGKTYYVKLEDERLMKAMRNIGPENNGTLIRVLGTVTRIMSSLNTSYNPEFVISNFSRDIQTALLNLSSEQTADGGKAKGKQVTAQTLKDTGTAIRAIYASLRGREATGKLAEWQKEFDQFRADGAKTGWFDMKDVDGQAKELETMIGAASGKGGAKLRRAFQASSKFVEDANASIENGVRLSAYVNAVKAGIPREKAASLAKNMTVNFNRRGELGTTMNALYMFANASVQGTANFVRTLGRINGIKGDPIWQRMNRAQKIAVGMAIAGFGLSVLNRMVAGEDDDDVNWWDKVPDYVKERNIVIMKSLFGGEPGEYWTIPLPYGYNIFPVIGTSMEQMIASDKPIGEAASNIVLAALGSFSPIGFEESKEVYGTVIKNIMPTVLKPVASISLNENFMGGPIFKENYPFGTPKPDSSLSFRSTPEAFKAIAETMNRFTGGSDYRSGAVDVSPDVMQFLIGYFGGGSYDFFTSRMPNAIYKASAGVELEAREIPFRRRLEGKVLPYDDQSKFYERRDEVNQLIDEARALKGPDRSRFIKDYGKKMRLKSLIKATEKQLKGLRQARDRIETLGLSAKAEDRRMQRVENQMKRVIDRFNQRYNEVD